MSTLAPPRPPRSDEDSRDLIEAARSRQRLRRRVVAGGALGAAAVAAVTYVVASAGGGGHQAQSPAGAAARGSGTIGLERPGALAVGPHGALYIADDGRNEILERLSSGTLRVVHGGLKDPGGMALARDGTLYVADTGNNRIVAIAPHGTMRIVAGNGKLGWVESGTPALQASVGSPAAVTIGPEGRLYIAATAASEILRLSADGRLARVAGIRGPAGISGVGRPATEASVAGPVGLAFDAAGNLFVAGFNGKTLLRITPRGTLTLAGTIGGDYPSAGGLVAGLGGGVFATNRTSLLRLTPDGPRTIVDFTKKRLDGIGVFAAEGIAVDRAGNVYADTWAGNGFAEKTALVRTGRDGRMRVLWRAR